MRRGAALWALCFQFFVCEQVAHLGWTTPYSFLHHYISDLGAVTCGEYNGRDVCSPWHAVMNASFFVQGLLISGGALFVGGEFAKLGRGFLFASGLGLCAVGLAPEDSNSQVSLRRGGRSPCMRRPGNGLSGAANRESRRRRRSRPRADSSGDEDRRPAGGGFWRHGSLGSLCHGYPLPLLSKSLRDGCYASEAARYHDLVTPDVNLEEMGRAAKNASRVLARKTTDEKNACLQAMADALDAGSEAILAANAADLEAGREKGLTPALLDRLSLGGGRLASVAQDIRAVAELPDPVGEVFDEKVLASGVRLHRVRVPLGVLGVIYEARPNVTADIASLALKTGNAAILRGGSETLKTNVAILAALQKALRARAAFRRTRSSSSPAPTARLSRSFSSSTSTSTCSFRAAGRASTSSAARTARFR